MESPFLRLQSRHKSRMFSTVVGLTQGPARVSKRVRKLLKDIETDVRPLNSASLVAQGPTPSSRPSSERAPSNNYAGRSAIMSIRFARSTS
jgi:hypothetical protein